MEVKTEEWIVIVLVVGLSSVYSGLFGFIATTAFFYYYLTQKEKL